MKIQLSVEEGLAYQKFDAELKGFAAGVARTLDYVRGQRSKQLCNRDRLRNRRQISQRERANNNMGVLQNIYGGLTGGGTPNEQTAFNRDENEGDLAQTQGGALQDQGTALAGQFGSEYANQNGLQDAYRGQADTAYGQLQQTPGYTAEQQAEIRGNPNAAFQYYNPNQLQGDTSDYAQSLNTAAQQGQQYLQAAPDNQTKWQGGINTNLENSGDEAVSGLQSGLGSAVSGYGTSLDDYQLTPEEAQNIRNVAAQTTQGQYRKMNEQTALQAAAQGNTSPAALAAIRENLGRQGAIDAGNAASSAELAANQEAANRKLTAANNLYGAQSNSANQIYGAKQGTAANLANTETQANESIAANQGASANAEANLGYNAAQTGGAQKIATDSGIQSTGQNLASNADTNSSNRGTTVANQDIAGQTTYRNYLTGQQGAAQAGSQTAGNQQLSAYGGTTSAYGAQHGAVNNANAQAGNVAVGANSSSQNLQGSFLADGGTVVSPLTYGYSDEEMGLPMPKREDTPDIFRDYRQNVNSEGLAAGGGSSKKPSVSSSKGTTAPSAPVQGPTGGGGGGAGGGETSDSGFGGPTISIINAPPDYGTTQTGTDERINYGDGMQPADPVSDGSAGSEGGYSGIPYGDEAYDPYDENYEGDGAVNTAATRATIAERGPEAVISTKPSKYAALGRQVLGGIERALSGNHPTPPVPKPTSTRNLFQTRNRPKIHKRPAPAQSRPQDRQRHHDGSFRAQLHGGWRYGIRRARRWLQRSRKRAGGRKVLTDGRATRQTRWPPVDPRGARQRHLNIKAGNRSDRCRFSLARRTSCSARTARPTPLSR